MSPSVLVAWTEFQYGFFVTSGGIVAFTVAWIVYYIWWEYAFWWWLFVWRYFCKALSSAWV